MNDTKIRQVTFDKLLRTASILARKVKEIHEDKEVYIRVFLQNGENFYVLSWVSWEESAGPGEVIFFETESKSILVDIRHIDRIEFLYEKPKDTEIVGFDMGKTEKLKELKEKLEKSKNFVVC